MLSCVQFVSAVMISCCACAPQYSLAYVVGSTIIHTSFPFKETVASDMYWMLIHSEQTMNITACILHLHVGRSSMTSESAGYMMKPLPSVKFSLC